MEINCKIRRNILVNVKHYGGGVVSLYSDDYQSTEEYHKVLAEIKENNPKLKVTTMSFINEHPQIKGSFKELSVNFEEKQA